MPAASARHAPDDDDSDLQDLIAKSPRARGGGVEIESGRYAPSSAVNPCGILSLCCYTFPRCTKCIAILGAFGFISFLANVIFNPTQKMGIMGADYSAIKSAYDLSLSKVDHWCIQGDNDSCKCEDPLEPASRSEFKSWNAAHKANKKDVSLYRSVYGSEPTAIDEELGKPRPPIDVAFLGESVVEAMDGRWLGKRVVRAINRGPNGKEGQEAAKKPDIGKIFERLFRKDKGGPVEGVALGIAGDTTANVLWRLMHDEMPYDFNPQVWWLVLGMNDLTRMQCSEEIVVLGILRVVEEIRLRKPDAKIVINSLLPMINYQQMGAPKMADFAEFQRKRDEIREQMEIKKAKDEFKKKGLGKGRNLRKKSSDEEEKSKKKGKKRTKKQREQDEDNAEEGPDLEKALERRKKILEMRDKRLKNKVFKDDEKYHPKKSISPFLPMVKKHVLPPVWPSVHVINEKLKEFCQKHDNISFFDATPLFSAQEGPGKHRLRNELISPRGHPSEIGFAVWEGNIMGRLHKMLEAKPEKKIEPAPAPEPELETDTDSENEEIEPMHETKDDGGNVDDNDSNDENNGETGSGEDGVSEGKEQAEPPKAKQFKRPPPKEESKGSGDAEEGEEDGDEDSSPKTSESKASPSAKEDTKKKASAKKESSEASDSAEASASEEEEEDKKKVSKKVSKKPVTKKEDSKEEEEEEQEDKKKVSKKVSKKPVAREDEDKKEEKEEEDDNEDDDDDEEEEE